MSEHAAVGSAVHSANYCAQCCSEFHSVRPADRAAEPPYRQSNGAANRTVVCTHPCAHMPTSSEPDCGAHKDSDLSTKRCSDDEPLAVSVHRFVSAAVARANFGADCTADPFSQRASVASADSDSLGESVMRTHRAAHSATFPRTDGGPVCFAIAHAKCSADDPAISPAHSAAHSAAFVYAHRRAHCDALLSAVQ